MGDVSTLALLVADLKVSKFQEPDIAKMLFLICRYYSVVFYVIGKACLVCF